MINTFKLIQKKNRKINFINNKKLIINNKINNKIKSLTNRYKNRLQKLSK